VKRCWLRMRRGKGKVKENKWGRGEGGTETETVTKCNRMRIGKCTTKDGIIIKNLRCVKNIKRKFICAKFVDFTLIFVCHPFPFLTAL